MQGIENLVIQILLQFVSVQDLNGVLSDPRTVAVLIGALVAVSGALLGSFLLLRRMSMISDAISHTVLLGIVGAFLIMTRVFGAEPDLSSPWLITGAALVGVLTVFLMETIFKSGMVKADASLGLVFPLLFGIAIIIVSRYAGDVHLDQDSVMVGQVGLAWANANDHCLDNCEEVIITPDDPRMEVGRRCINCQPVGDFNPRDAGALFEEYCFNCGTYSASDAARAGLVDTPPTIVFFPRNLTTMAVISLINVLFVVVFYKELKLATFDHALAEALGFRPGLLHYLLMVLVSVTAVGAFDAVGAVLVVAFFIVPAATAYLLTERLSIMLLLSSLIGALAAYTGWDFSHGSLFGVYDVDRALVFLDRHVVDLGGHTEWNVEPAAAMVMMTGLFFLIGWVISPRYGLVSSLLRRWSQRRVFSEQMLLVHVCNHQGSDTAQEELSPKTLHQHLKWSPARVRRVLWRLRAQNLITVRDGMPLLTSRGQERVQFFNRGIRTGAAE